MVVRGWTTRGGRGGTKGGGGLAGLPTVAHESIRTHAVKKFFNKENIHLDFTFST